LPAEWCPEAARVRIGNSARGDRSRSTLQACLPERRPSIERDSHHVSETGTNVKMVSPITRPIFSVDFLAGATGMRYILCLARRLWAGAWSLPPNQRKTQ